MGPCQSKQLNLLATPPNAPPPPPPIPIKTLPPPTTIQPNTPDDIKQPITKPLTQNPMIKIFNNKSCPITNNIYLNIILKFPQYQPPILGLRGNVIQQWKLIKTIYNLNQWWYFGQWNNQRMEGHGHLYNKNKKILVTGLFLSHDILQTKCRIIFQNGSHYIGPITKGYEPKGYGSMHFPDGTIYNGQFLQGLPTGNKSQNRYSLQSDLTEGSTNTSSNNPDITLSNKQNLAKKSVDNNTLPQLKTQRSKLPVQKPPSQKNKQNILH